MRDCATHLIGSVRALDFRELHLGRKRRVPNLFRAMCNFRYFLQTTNIRLYALFDMASDFLANLAPHCERAGYATRRKRIHRYHCAGGSVLGAFICGAALAAPGSLDLTFGFGNGKVITPITASADDNAHAMLIQPDGKIVVVGACGTTSSRNFCVARFESTGALDTAFSSDGKVITQVGSGNSDAYAVALQSDGKIVVAGQCGIVSARDFCLVRYNPNGTVNANFGTNGQVITAVGTGDDALEGMAIQSDGKIVVVGTCRSGSYDAFCVVRYESDGTLDASFASDGKVITSIVANADDVARAVAIQSDGKIVVAGYCGDSAVKVDFCAARYLSTGVLDTSFDFDGRVTASIGDYIDAGSAISLQADGRIVIAGTTTITGSSPQMSAVRHNPFGSLDTSFSTNGRLTFRIGSGTESAQGVALQPDGKVVIAGSCLVGGNDDFCVARRNSDGTPDNTFSVNGSVITPISVSDDDRVAGVALDNEGNIVVAGSCGASPNRDFCIARYEGGPFGARNCSLDIDGDGKVLATTDMLIGTRVALGVTGAAVLNGINFPPNATRDQWGTNTSRDIRKYLVSQCGMSIAP